jgi:hypothetical protein
MGHASFEATATSADALRVWDMSAVNNDSVLTRTGDEIANLEQHDDGNEIDEARKGLQHIAYGHDDAGNGRAAG